MAKKQFDKFDIETGQSLRQTIKPEDLPDDTADKTYTHVQGIASATWTIVHNMNKRPSVVAVDQNEQDIEAPVTYIDENSLQIKFDAPYIGKAYLN